MLKYSKDLTKAIEGWVADNGLKDCGGASYASLCRNFNIELNTFKSWMKKPEFKASIDRAKSIFAENIERDIVISLAKAAKGYKYVKTRTEYGTAKNGKEQVKRRVVEEIEVAPNVGAAIFILTNIAPERWQNKQNQISEIQGDLSLSVNVVTGGTPKIASSEKDVEKQ